MAINWSDTAHFAILNPFIYKSEVSGKSYRFNTEEKLNVFLLRMICRFGLVKSGRHVIRDCLHIPVLPYQRLEINGERHHHILQ